MDEDDGAAPRRPAEEGAAVSDEVREPYLMRAAAALVSRGMYVFPLWPGTKRPAVRSGWELEATIDLDRIRSWWSAAPYNIAVATGPSDLVVVDLDAPHSGSGGPNTNGRQTLGRLAQKAGTTIPRATFTVVTAGGGQHLYFRADGADPLGNTAGRLGPHVDTRAHGGYVVGPGSVIAGRRYRIVRADDPLPLPGWIRHGIGPDTIAEPSYRSVRTGEVSTAYVQAALDGEAERVVHARVGERNHAVFRAAARLGSFVADGHLSADQVRDTLSTAAERHIGVDVFTAAELHRTIESGLRRGRTGSATSGVRALGPATAADPSAPHA